MAENKIDKELLSAVADLHDVPMGAFNIRKDGEGVARQSTENIIITPNGKNVYPEEIEAVIQHVEGVTEVVVYEDEKLICAEIYTETPDEKDRIKADVQALNKNLPSYKQIQKIVFRDTEFEKTTTKKIKRFVIKNK